MGREPIGSPLALNQMRGLEDLREVAAGIQAFRTLAKPLPWESTFEDVVRAGPLNSSFAEQVVSLKAAGLAMEDQLTELAMKPYPGAGNEREKLIGGLNALEEALILRENEAEINQSFSAFDLKRILNMAKTGQLPNSDELPETLPTNKKELVTLIVETLNLNPNDASEMLTPLDKTSPEKHTRAAAAASAPTVVRSGGPRMVMHRITPASPSSSSPYSQMSADSATPSRETPEAHSMSTPPPVNERDVGAGVETELW